MSKQIDYVVEFKGFSGNWHQSNSANLGINRNPFSTEGKAMLGVRRALRESGGEALDYRIVRRTRVVKETMAVVAEFPKEKR